MTAVFTSLRGHFHGLLDGAIMTGHQIGCYYPICEVYKHYYEANRHLSQVYNFTPGSMIAIFKHPGVEVVKVQQGQAQVSQQLLVAQDLSQNMTAQVCISTAR